MADDGVNVPTDDGFRGTREEMERAIRRLNVLEYVILGFAVLVALAGGAAVAFILSSGTNLPFRLTWAVLSILLLVIPGALVLGKDRAKKRRPPGEDTNSEHPRRDRE
jgi:predicted lysophospholipase L1 biosynthesis ABC-type transport system permease subunit